ncbi:MAG: amidohydrolase family protein [Gemmatimonadales bacterium]
MLLPIQAVAGLLLAVMAVPCAAQAWDVEKSTAPATARLDFVATEGTWMNLDVSPDGETIVFDLLGHIYQMPIGGGEARPLTSGRSWNMFPRFSPEGSRILFTSDRTGVEDLWYLERASGGLVNVTKAASPVYQGSWSKDGRFVYGSAYDESLRIQAFQFGLHGSRQELHRTGVFQPATHFIDDPARGRIYFEHRDRTLYASGARIKFYDKETGRIGVLVERPGGAANPALSPDGRWLAYVHRDFQTSELVVHDLETGQERAIYRPLERDRQDYGVYQHGAYPNMAWHPNGREILVWVGGRISAVRVSDGTARDIPFRAAVVRDVDRTIRFPAVIPDSVATTRSHRWPSRSAAGVLFEALGDLHLTTGGSTRQLTATNEHETSPVLSPDGRTLYYASWSDDSLGHVYSQPLGGGPRARLSAVPAQYGALTLSADGRTLGYLRGGRGIERGLRLHAQTDYELILRGPDGRERTLTEVTWTANGAAKFPPTIRFDSVRARLLFTEFAGDTLVLRSVRADGSDQRTLYRFPHAVRAVVSPDLKWIAFQEYYRSYLAPFEFVGQTLTLSGYDRQGTSWRVDENDGTYAEWSADGATLSWVRGSGFYEKPVADILAGGKTATRTELGRPFATNRPSGVVALTGVRVITMDSARRVLENATIVIRNNRIAAVGRGVAIPRDAKVLHLPGRTVMPGIVDVHAHQNPDISPLNVVEQRSAELLAALAHGVTTMYEVYGNNEKDFWVSDQLRRGTMTGPRLFSTGPPMYGSRFFRPKQFRVMNTADDIRQTVQYNKDYGATALKDYLTPNRRVRADLATAARAAGLNLDVEPGGEGPTNFTRAIDGATGIAHGMGFTTVYQDVIKLLGATTMGITPTLIVTLDGPMGESYFYQTERVWENAKLLRFARRDELVTRIRPTMYWPDDQYAPRLAATMKRLHDAGVSIQLGGHGQQLGLDAHWEMELLAQGGFRPMEVLQVATLNGARFQGLDRELGSLEVGKLADLVVLARNPLDNVRNAREVVYVMVNGVVYSGEDAARIHPDPAPTGRMYFAR